jgi:hypothetical protein
VRKNNKETKLISGIMHDVVTYRAGQAGVEVQFNIRIDFMPVIGFLVFLRLSDLKPGLYLQVRQDHISNSL